ncbi:hypothetical protein BJ508DRAFT_309430 [Ascobolus immersus RN42]|uniref:Uncharacterized protein n=1 Tax=Ascobolus immersus RN42 TaxID=1160509 RepID=A0A3N4I1T0_ASCIM|nr:hypothetical protein BJ508DRAFT_309430 [Ascobolus immersus RN42]
MNRQHYESTSTRHGGVPKAKLIDSYGSGGQEPLQSIKYYRAPEVSPTMIIQSRATFEHPFHGPITYLLVRKHNRSKMASCYVTVLGLDNTFYELDALYEKDNGDEASKIAAVYAKTSRTKEQDAPINPPTNGKKTATLQQRETRRTRKTRTLLHVCRTDKPEDMNQEHEEET